MARIDQPDCKKTKIVPIAKERRQFKSIRTANMKPSNYRTIRITRAMSNVLKVVMPNRKPENRTDSPSPSTVPDDHDDDDGGGVSNICCCPIPWLERITQLRTKLKVVQDHPKVKNKRFDWIEKKWAHLRSSCQIKNWPFEKQWMKKKSIDWLFIKIDN